MTDIEGVIGSWNGLIKAHSALLKAQLDELEVSALSALIEDCYQSFHELYFVLLKKLKEADPSDFDLVHSCVVDMYWQFDHIKNHIVDAEKGFAVLMDLLAEKAESKEKED